MLETGIAYAINNVLLRHCAEVMEMRSAYALAFHIRAVPLRLLASRDDALLAALVGLPGIEPGLRPPHGRVLPVYYSPIVFTKGCVTYCHAPSASTARIFFLLPTWRTVVYSEIDLQPECFCFSRSFMILLCNGVAVQNRTCLVISNMVSWNQKQHLGLRSFIPPP